MGLDEALDQFCRDHLDQFMSRDEPAPDKAQPPHALSKPLNVWQRDQASPKARGTIGTDSNRLSQANQGQIIDEAIHSLWADESRPVRTSLTPTSVPLTSDGTTLAETAPVDATLLSTEPVQRQDGSLLSSYERGFEALTEFAVSLLLAAFVARRIDPPARDTVLPRIRSQAFGCFVGPGFGSGEASSGRTAFGVSLNAAILAAPERMNTAWSCVGVAARAARQARRARRNVHARTVILSVIHPFKTISSAAHRPT